MNCLHYFRTFTQILQDFTQLFILKDVKQFLILQVLPWKYSLSVVALSCLWLLLRFTKLSKYRETFFKNMGAKLEAYHQISANPWELSSRVLVATNLILSVYRCCGRLGKYEETGAL